MSGPPAEAALPATCGRFSPERETVVPHGSGGIPRSGFSYPLRDTRNALALVPQGDSHTLLMEKKRVSAILNEIGMLLELKGENPFKCRAYGNAARVIEGLAGDLGELVKSGELSKIKGIGEALSQKITELVTTGPNRGTDDRANLQSSN